MRSYFCLLMSCLTQLINQSESPNYFILLQSSICWQNGSYLTQNECKASVISQYFFNTGIGIAQFATAKNPAIQRPPNNTPIFDPFITTFFMVSQLGLYLFCCPFRTQLDLTYQPVTATKDDNATKLNPTKHPNFQSEICSLLKLFNIYSSSNSLAFTIFSEGQFYRLIYNQITQKLNIKGIITIQNQLSNNTYCLHIGHTFYLPNQDYKHQQWNQCLQFGIFVITSPIQQLLKQTVHLSQLAYFIYTFGRFWITSIGNPLLTTPILSPSSNSSSYVILSGSISCQYSAWKRIDIIKFDIYSAYPETRLLSAYRYLQLVYLIAYNFYFIAFIVYKYFCFSDSSLYFSYNATFFYCFLADNLSSNAFLFQTFLFLLSKQIFFRSPQTFELTMAQLTL